MATYYDYIPGAVQWRTPALNPSNECGTFLSYKLTDWVNKIGPNYAQIWTNHEEWEASDRYVNGTMTNDENAYIQLRLLGRDYRAGTLTATGIEPWAGIGFHKTKSRGVFQFQLLKKPARLDTLLGYTRNNLVRDSYGHTNPVETFGIHTNYNILDNPAFVTPRITRVLYSDTPGNRYFAWQINGTLQTGGFGVLYETQVREDLPAGADPGWVFTTGYIWNSINNWDPQNYGNYRFYYNSNGFRMNSTYAPGTTQNATYSQSIYSSAPTLDYHGDIIGISKGFHYGANNQFSQNYTYKIGGKKYFAWSDSFLLPID